MIVSNWLDGEEDGWPKVVGDMREHFVQPFATKVFQHSTVRNEQRVRNAVFQ